MKGGSPYAAERRGTAGKTSAASIRRRDREAEGEDGPGRVEHAQPREGVAGVHRGLQVAKPRGVLRGSRGDRRVPEAQVGKGARLQVREEPLVLHGQPHRGQVRVREPRRGGAVVEKSWE